MRVVVVGVVLALIVAGCAQPRRGTGAPRTEPAMTTPMNDPVLLAAADSLGPQLEQRFPDTYSGLRLEQERGVLAIYRVPDAALDEVARAGAQGAKLELRDAKFPLKRLKEVTEQIGKDSDALKEQGVQLATWGPAGDGSGVRVTTVDGSDSDRAVLTERYGPDIIRVEQGERPVPVGR
jgi:hypothetical protein